MDIGYTDLKACLKSKSEHEHVLSMAFSYVHSPYGG